MPIHIAALHGKLDVVKFCIEFSSSASDASNVAPTTKSSSPNPLVSISSQHGWTPLLLAISSPKANQADRNSVVKCVEFLLEHGADPNK